MIGVELLLLRTTEGWVFPAIRDAAARDPDAVGAAVRAMSEDDRDVDDDGIDVWAAPTLWMAPGTDASAQAERDAPVTVDDAGRVELRPTMLATLSVSAADALRVGLELDRTRTTFDALGRMVLGPTDHLSFVTEVPTTPGATVVAPSDDLVLVVTVADAGEDGPGWLSARDLRRAQLLAAAGRRDGRRRPKVERALLAPSPTPR